MKTSLTCLIAAITLLSFSVAGGHAQERTAGGNLQTEASWSALKTLVDRTQGNIDLVRIELNAMQKCNDQKKLYSKTTGQCLDIIDARVDEMVKCGNLNKIYSTTQKGCVEVAGGNRWVYSRVGPTATSDAYAPSYAMIQVRHALSSMGIGECAATTQGKKCSPAGAQCAVLTTTSSGGGSHSYGPDTTVSTNILICN